MTRRLNLVGQKFNRLLVLEDTKKNKNHSSLWICKCDCGKIKTVRGIDLKTNNTKSCGCLNKEKQQERNKNNTYGKANKGKIRSEDFKRKLSEINKGKILSIETKLKISKASKGKNNPFYGKHHSDETKLKISNNNKGEKSGRYKHGLTNTKVYNANRTRKRTARKLKQTPILTIIEEIRIQSYYKKSQELGSNYHVDHIQPLSKGGLHHPNNLQILTAKINDQKFNKWPLTEMEKIKYRGIRLIA